MDFEEEKIIKSCACWFVNRFWNDIYSDASAQYYEINEETILENYKNILQQFNLGFKSDVPIHRKHDSLYGIIMEDICKYYNEECGNNKNIYQFINAIARIILGNEEYMTQRLNDEQLDKITKNIMRETLSYFVVYILKSDLRGILFRDKKLPNEWYEKYLKIFDDQIIKYRTYIMALRNGVDITKGQDIEMVPMAVVDTLKAKIKELMYQNEQLTNDYNKLVRYIQNLSITGKSQHSEIMNNSPYQHTPIMENDEGEELQFDDSGDIYSYDE